MIKLYGAPGSRAQRCLWMLEELGIPYENVPTDFRTAAQQPELLRLNPNGKVPVLEDEKFVLWESMAINLYLAERYGSEPFWPGSLADRAHTCQWSFWVMAEIEPPLVDFVMNRALLPEPQRDEAVAAVAEKRMRKRLPVLDGALSGRDYLLGPEFTAADLNVVSVLSPAPVLTGMDLGDFSNLSRWLDACTSRAAMARAFED